MFDNDLKAVFDKQSYEFQDATTDSVRAVGKLEARLYVLKTSELNKSRL